MTELAKSLIPISEMFFGFTDGKHEFNEVDEETFVRSYFVPENLDISGLIKGRKFIVIGSRGSGKTTLLRWVAHSLRYDKIVDFLLFKSEVSEQQKQDLSKAAGISEISFEGPDKGVFQDFRDLWRIIILGRLCEMIISNSHGVDDIRPAKAILKISGVQDEASGGNRIFARLLSLMRLKWTDVSTGMEWEGGLWGDLPKGSEKLTPRSLALVISKIFESISFRSSYVLLLDELEIFYKTREQFTRDSDIVRDSVVVCEELRRWFKEIKAPIDVVVALRDEVINSIGARGEEIYKVIDDYSVKLDWSARKSTEGHPLVRMIKKKMPSQIDPDLFEIAEDALPTKINGAPYYKYLSDNTCCKPRNIVARLNVIKDKFPNDFRFEQHMFDETEAEYSAKLWKETEYLLGASHSDLSISGLKRCFFAWKGRFSLEEFESRANYLKKYHDREISALINERYISMFERMFEYGAIGNVYKDNFLNRNMFIWSYRGESVFQPNRPVEIQRALWKHLSIVSAF